MKKANPNHYGGKAFNIQNTGVNIDILDPKSHSAKIDGENCAHLLFTLQSGFEPFIEVVEKLQEMHTPFYDVVFREAFHAELIKRPGFRKLTLLVFRGDHERSY